MMIRSALLVLVLGLLTAGGCCAPRACTTCGDCGPVDECASGDCGRVGCSKCDHCTWLSRCGIFRGCCGCCSEELGCGEMWWGDWFENPPSRCQPCDQCGNWTGPPPYPARGYAPQYPMVARRGEPTLAQREQIVEPR